MSDLNSVGLTEFQNKIADYVDRVHFSGQRLVVTKHGKPWLVVVPYIAGDDHFHPGSFQVKNVPANEANEANEAEES